MNKVIFIVCLGFIIALSAFASGSNPIVTELPDGSRYIANRILVMLDDNCIDRGLADDVIEALSALPGVAGVEPLYKGHLRKPALKSLAAKIYRVILDENCAAAYCLDRFKNINGVRYAELQYIPEFYYTPNDPYIGQYWHLGQTHTFEAWDYVRGDTTRHSIIGIIDTGINYRHNDLEPNIWINEFEDINHDGYFDSSDENGADDDGNGFVDDVIGWNFASDNNDPMDGMPHGTGVACCASEATDNGYLGAGAGFSARLMSLKGITDGGYLVEGYICMLYAADNGAQIVNCSWGIPVHSDIEQNIINAAWGEDLLIIAGGGDGSQVVYPAAYDHVIAVSSTDQNDRITPFAPYGEYIDICAPAINIPMVWGDDYLILSGTSFATGIVSGIAALVRTWYPSYTNEEIWQVIADAADDIDSLNHGHAGELGAGRINAANCITTGIDHEPILPSGTEFFYSYPNPFNAATTIKYELDKSSEIIVNIYDILGRKVASLESGPQDAGIHSLTWNANNLPSGVYFAKVSNSKESAVLKMLLIK